MGAEDLTLEGADNDETVVFQALTDHIGTIGYGTVPYIVLYDQIRLARAFISTDVETEVRQALHMIGRNRERHAKHEPTYRELEGVLISIINPILINYDAGPQEAEVTDTPVNRQAYGHLVRYFNRKDIQRLINQRRPSPEGTYRPPGAGGAPV